MSWRGGIRRDKTDKVFSHLVRERADWCCERCTKPFRHNPGKLHCSHVFGRAKKGVRWHPINAFAHCLACHDYLSQHPVEFAEWAKGKLGDGTYQRLQVLANKVTKFTKADKALIHKHLLAEKKRLDKLRAEGKQGRIGFTMYPIGVLQ